MAAAPNLLDAKKLIDEASYDAARSMYQEIVAGGGVERLDALYALGIMWQIGNFGGAETSDCKAAYYYSLAADEGHVMAAYQLAGYYEKQDRSAEALDLLKKIAGVNASAAYWVWRMLIEKPQLASHPEEAATYLNLAIDQGHLLAKKVRLLRRLKGQEGLLKALIGPIEFVRWFIGAYRAASSNDKEKYT